MDEKMINLLIDIVKYVATVALLYPFLAGMEKNGQYYTIVGTGVAIGVTAIIILQRFAKKKKNNGEHQGTNNDRRKYKYKYKYKSITKN
jgi:uncharacterized membrane protein